MVSIFSERATGSKRLLRTEATLSSLEQLKFRLTWWTGAISPRSGTGRSMAQFMWKRTQPSGKLLLRSKQGLLFNSVVKHVVELKLPPSHRVGPDRQLPTASPYFQANQSFSPDKRIFGNFAPTPSLAQPPNFPSFTKPLQILFGSAIDIDHLNQQQHNTAGGSG